MRDVVAAARDAYAAGCCPLPVAEDGSKIPHVKSWTPYQHERPTLTEVERLHRGRSGIGLVCGPVSGNLEAIDFDDRAIFDEFLIAAEACGLWSVVERIDQSYRDTTPNGVRWLWRCDTIAGNQELAKHPDTEPNKWKPLIETRGSGGFAIVAPSGGAVHPSGQPYVRVHGSFATIPTVTSKERAALFALARTFDQRPPPPEHKAKPNGSVPTAGGRPGDAFHESTTWDTLLTEHGWTAVYARGDRRYWRRPGKDRGVSATTGNGARDLLWVFTSSTAFESNRSYDRFAAYAVLEHHGNFEDAARALRQQGYGAVTPEAAPRAADAWRLLDDVELLSLPDPQWLIENVIPACGVVVIYGPSGACKTTLVAALQGSLATGQPFFGHSVIHTGPSVYVAAEDPSGFKLRLAAWKRAHGFALDRPIGVYTFPEPIDLCSPDSVSQFSTFLRRATAALPLQALIIDTYASATPGANENSSEDTTTAMAHARQWRDALRCAVALVHHTNAGGTRERGHSAMRGAADAMIVMTPIDDTIQLECSKQRNAAPFPDLVLKLTPCAGGGCVLRLAADVLPGGPSPTQRKVFEVLRTNFFASGATKGEWQRACADVAERSFYRAAKTLVETGYVAAEGAYFRVKKGMP